MILRDDHALVMVLSTLYTPLQEFLQYPSKVVTIFLLIDVEIEAQWN